MRSSYTLRRHFAVAIAAYSFISVLQVAGGLGTVAHSRVLPDAQPNSRLVDFDNAPTQPPATPNSTVRLLVAASAAQNSKGDATGSVTAPGRPAVALDTSGFTGLYLRSTPGEYVGAGLTYVDMAPAYTITASPGYGLQFDIQASNSTWYLQHYWTLSLATPDGSPFSVGAYEGAITTPLHGSLPGLSFYGTGRACGSEIGRYSVLEIEYAGDGTPLRFAADFVRSCGVGSPPLFGEIRYNSTIPFAYSAPAGDASPDPFALVMVPTVAPGWRVTSIPTTVYGINVPVPISVVNGEYSTNGGAFTSAPGTVVNTDMVTVATTASMLPGTAVTTTLTIGDYAASATVSTYAQGAPWTGLRLRSEPGEFVGSGVDRIYIAPTDQFTQQPVSNGISTIHIAGHDGVPWSIYLSGPGRAQLLPGSYLNATGLSPSGLNAIFDVGRGSGSDCGESVASLTVHEVAYLVNGEIDRLAADFQQQCVDGAGAMTGVMTGEIRINSSRPFSSLRQDSFYGVKIKKLGNGAGAAIADGGELSCGANCVDWFPLGQVLTLTATPADGSAFKGWFGAASSCALNPVCTFTLVDPVGVVISPRFESATTLSLKFSGGGTGFVTWGPTTFYCYTDCSQQFDVNSVVTLRAAAYAGSVFTGWSGCSSSVFDTCTVTVDAAKTVTANFVLGFEFGAFFQGSGGGRIIVTPIGLDCSSPCVKVVDPGTVVTLTAIPDANSILTGWAGISCGIVQPCTFTVTRETVVTAIFQRVVWEATVAIGGSGSGTVTSTNGAINCGAVCTASLTTSGMTLVATPSPGSVFSGWSGPCAGTGNCPLFGGNNVAVTAIFNAVGTPVSAITGLYYRNTGANAGAIGAVGFRGSPDYAITVSGTLGLYFNIRAANPQGPSQDYYTLSLAAQTAVQLAVGAYEGAERAPFADASPGLEFDGVGSGCNNLSGRFTVLEAVYAPDGTIARFAADFVQSCERVFPPVFGEIRYNSTIPFSYSAAPGDTTPDPIALVMRSPADPGARIKALPTYVYGINAPTPISVVDGEYSINGGAYTSAPGTVVNTDSVGVRTTSSSQPGGTVQPALTIGNFTTTTTVTTYVPGTPLTGMLIRSEPGDYIGLGLKQLYLSPADRFVGLSIFNRNTDWRLAFSGPGGAPLAPGVYEGAARTASATNPGMEVTAGSRGCNQMTGRFIVYEVAYLPNGAYDRLALDFEQHCEGVAAALYGELRINSTRPFSSLSHDVAHAVSFLKYGNGLGTIAGSAGEFSCGPVCLAWLPSDYLLSMTATPAPGSVFKGWQGAGSCSLEPGCDWLVGNSSAVVTRFEIPTRLNVEFAGTAFGAVYVGGTFCASNCGVDFDIHTVVPLQAFGSPGVVFTGWSGGGCSGTGSCMVTLDAETTVTATFVPGYRISVSSSQQGGSGRVISNPAGIDCGTSCELVVDLDTLVTLSALPEPGAVFIGWGGACSGTGACTPGVNSDRYVFAVFALGDRLLTVGKTGSGAGTVASTSGGVINCGTACTGNFSSANGIVLQAVPAPDSIFTGWSGACSGVGICSIGGTSDATVTANFDTGQIPGAPTITDVTPGDGRIRIGFSPPASTGGLPLANYTVTCAPGAATSVGLTSPLMVQGLNNGTTYSCTVHASNGVGAGPESAPAVATPTAPPILLSAVSLKTHGASGVFPINIALNPPPGGETVEPRDSSLGHLIVLTFDQVVTSVQSGSVTDALGAGIGMATVQATNSNEIFITLTGIADGQVAVVNVDGLNGTLSANSVRIALLLGDGSGNGAVTASDILMVKRQSGMPVGANNFRADVNHSGAIDSLDLLQVKSRSGHKLP